MDGDEIGMVMCRVSELRSKITGCIHKAAAEFEDDDGEQSTTENEADEEEKVSPAFKRLCYGEAEGESQSLFGIRDALDSLEEQLSSLQALQHQQLYERGSTLAEIDESRKILLKKLKEYKGENLEVVQEAFAFAGGTVENGGDLFLPPYPSRLPESVIYEGRYRPWLPSSNMQLAHLVAGKHATETTMNGSHKQLNQMEPPVGEKKSQSGIKSFIGWAAKTVITIAGIVSVLSLAGFEPRIRRRNVQFKPLNLLSEMPHVGENTTEVRCPPGKILVMEDDIPRCIVKERIEVPFEPVLKAPDVLTMSRCNMLSIGATDGISSGLQMFREITANKTSITTRFDKDCSHIMKAGGRDIKKLEVKAIQGVLLPLLSESFPHIGVHPGGLSHWSNSHEEVAIVAPNNEFFQMASAHESGPSCL